MQEFNEILKFIDSFIGSHFWFALFLLGTGLFFTIYLRFPQIKFFRHAISIVSGKYDKKSDIGDASHFQALATALSGTVGTGNIAGVAFAIFLGGPAALFWMVITAMLGMTTKFVEVTLSHKYREVAEDGSISGGPMYYMKNKLNMKWLAVIFAVATIFSSFGTGSLPQINSISTAIESTFGLEGWITGLVLALLLGFVIIGGIKRIAKVTEKLVPIMAIIYLIGAFAVIFYNIDNVVPSLKAIVADVFTGSAATGGFLGATLSFAFRKGVGRGLFSNEAGQGSAPIAHAAAKTEEPVSEGIVAILEPFIDTIVICTITGLTLLSSGVWNKKHFNEFQMADMKVMNKVYNQNNTDDVKNLFLELDNYKSTFTGNLNVENGIIKNNLTIVHARSIAEDIIVYSKDKPYTGLIKVTSGDIPRNRYVIKGKSLVHSAPLTAIAFQSSYFGHWGQYIVSIGILLFAFSTAISWSYYGGRAITFLFGSKAVIYYRMFYIVAFFVASFTDTTIVWTFSGITIALMTIPNLIGILILRKDMKESVKDYQTRVMKDLK